MAEEKRTRTRVPLQLSVTVIVENVEIPVQTWNLSLRGMGCTPDQRFTAESACSVRFTLGTETTFTIDGTFVRCSESEAGVFFSSMDEDAFYHLKRLVQYNTENPDIIDKELAK